MEWYILLFAFVLDLIVGDPTFLPHPVVFMGKAIEFFEPLFRKIVSNQVFCGALFAVFLIGSTFALTYGIISLCRSIDFFFGQIVSCVFMFFTLSSKSLYKAAMDVKIALETSGIESGRDKIAMIVGREVKSLDQTGIVRAAVETVAENFVDGFLSPLFFALIGGVPCAVAYKMVNTLDSMVGYKNEKYIEFGRASAKIDDVANFIPARISVIIIAAGATLFPGKRGFSSLKTGLREGRFHKSPNAGFPEASFAGALHIKLGGPNYYHGKLVDKPYIGNDFNDSGLYQIKQACELMLFSSFLSIIISCFIIWL
ncbi:MAG: cobalamin biosynthesis protein CobD [Desulfobacterales bacterium]|nr:cobalamin biosynthesis protein CobD [Desulfobacterales bacterium]